MNASDEQSDYHSDYLQDDDLFSSNDNSLPGSDDDGSLGSDDDGLFEDPTQREDLGCTTAPFENEGEKYLENEDVDYRCDHRISHIGTKKMTCIELNHEVNSPGFDINRAIELLHTQVSIDYGEDPSSSRDLKDIDDLTLQFFIDYLAIVGLPLQRITNGKATLMASVKISFRWWKVSYSGKNMFDLGFELRHRTFHIAKDSTRMNWYIVFHPRQHELTPLSPVLRRRSMRAAARESAIRPQHAHLLVSYITRIFLKSGLVGRGIDRSWNLGGRNVKDLPLTTWVTFQDLFIEGWSGFVEEYADDSFWSDHNPCFHCYDYGANIPIEPDDFRNPNTNHQYPLEQRQKYRERDTNGASGSPLTGSSMSIEPEVLSDHESEYSRGRSQSRRPPHQQQTRRFRSLSPPPIPDLPPILNDPPNYHRLANELKDLYELSNVRAVSFAIAWNIHHKDEDDNIYGILANRSAIKREFTRQRKAGIEFFPMAFNPSYVNFQSTGSPMFAEQLFQSQRTRVQAENNRSDALRHTFHQGYNIIKNTIRHSPQECLLTEGAGTGALCLPEDIADSVSKRRQMRLLAKVEGKMISAHPGDITASYAVTPMPGSSVHEDAIYSQLFSREGQRIKDSILAGEIGYRMEQIYDIDVSRLVQANRNMNYVLRVIPETMTFICDNISQHASLFRRFRAEVFPGILITYSKIFRCVLEHLKSQWTSGRKQGLCGPLSEAMAFLERVAVYAFTGNTKAIQLKVIEELRTLDSLFRHGWPYVDRNMLDIGRRRYEIEFWPRDDRGHPMLLHLRALEVHYGPSVRDGRLLHLSLLDFRGRWARGPSEVKSLVETVVQDMLTPQMTQFLQHQWSIELKAQSREEREELRHELKRWTESDRPFSHELFVAIFRRIFPGKDPVTCKDRITFGDFAKCLYNDAIKFEQTHRRRWASRNSSWFTTLHKLLKLTPIQVVSNNHWTSAIQQVLQSKSIHCLPSYSRGRIVSSRYYHLGGTMISDAIQAPSLETVVDLQVNQTDDATHSNRRICFPETLPFESLPNIIREGYETYKKRNPNHEEARILEARGETVKGSREQGAHYDLVKDVMEEHLMNNKVQLLLLIVCTLSASTVVPFLPKSANDDWVPSPKSTKPADWGFLVAVRVMWLLYPESFNLESTGGIMGMKEMATKIEHIFGGSRVLLKLGFVQRSKAKYKRNNPKMEEMELQSDDELKRMHDTLSTTMGDARRFIAAVFRSDNPEWFNRCHSICREQTAENDNSNNFVNFED